MLQTLLILLRKVPPTPGRRLFIVASTSISYLLEELQLTDVNIHIDFPLLLYLKFIFIFNRHLMW